MTKLFISSGTGKVRAVDFGDEPIFVGRSSHNDIQTVDRFVSRTHLKIFKDGGKIFVKDLRSRNGTYVNGRKMVPDLPFEIERGHVIIIGMTVVCLSEEPTEDVVSFMRSIKPAQIHRNNGGGVSEDRPMTARNNIALICNVAHLTMEPLSLKKILEQTLSHILDLLKRADRGIVILIDRETGGISAVISKFRNGIKKPYAMDGRAIVDRVVREGKSVAIPDTQKAEYDNLSETMQLKNTRSVMCLPLISKSQVRGVLYVDSNRSPNAFRRDDPSLFEAFSGTTAIAIENALLQGT